MLKRKWRVYAGASECKTGGIVWATGDKMVQQEDKSYLDFKNLVAMARLAVLQQQKGFRRWRLIFLFFFFA